MKRHFFPWPPSTRSGTRSRNSLTALLAGVALLGCAAAASAQQYKWRDRDGSVVYGDSPPREARHVERVSTIGGDGDDDPLRGLPFELTRAARSYPVVLYVSPGAPACDAARAYLKRRGVPFAERTITSNDDIAEMQRRGFGNRVPVLQVGSDTLNGFSEDAWAGALDAAGYPAASRLPRGWAGAPPRPLVEPKPAAESGTGAPGAPAALGTPAAGSAEAPTAPQQP